MKCLLLLSVAIVACAASILKDPVQGYKEGDRYFYISGDGDDPTIHLVDTEEPADLEFIEQYTRNPADNAYWVFTRANPTTAQHIRFGDEGSIADSNIDFSKNTVILAHGWKADGVTSLNEVLPKAFLEDDDVNVIILDWSRLADRTYITAKAGTAAVGRGLGQFVNWLVSLGMSYEKVHLIGFSLGGHLVGNAGRETGGLVKRITALDPAGPLWHNDNERVVATDAQYVEVIHTDSVVLGFGDPCGDADFYPNGGKNQPGCSIDAFCSHARSYQLLGSSVKYNKLLANECNSLSEATSDTCTGDLYPMGNSDLSKSRSGIFRLNTLKDYPY